MFDSTSSKTSFITYLPFREFKGPPLHTQLLTSEGALPPANHNYHISLSWLSHSAALLLF